MRSMAIGAAVVLLATGCSSDQQEQQAESGVTTREVEAQMWAGELCAATDELQAEVSAIADSIAIDPTAGLDQLPQIYAQIQGSLTRVEAGVDAVESVLLEAPASSPEAVTFATQVQALVRSSRLSGEEARVAADQAVNADNFLEAGLAAATAVAASRQAYDEAGQALALVERTRNGEAPQLREAFAAAPECQPSP